MPIKGRMRWWTRVTCCVMFVPVFIVLLRFMDVDFQSIGFSSRFTYSKELPVKYLYNIDQWRQIFLANRQLLNSNPWSWCDVPAPLQRLANALCQVYWRKNCPRLPCYLIYNETRTSESVQCLHGGRKMTGDQPYPDIRCQKGIALEFFLNRTVNYSYPSIIADSLMPMSEELYVNVLNSTFRDRSSIWGFYFNFESISNYPWSANRKFLDLFDITFGYDRDLYDVVPGPWLFNYVDQLKPGKRRLSLKEVIQKKTSIRSKSALNFSWIEDARGNTGRDGNERVDVTAAVLWMNSNCQTHSKRTEFMTEFMKYLDVDNFGTCGPKTRPVPSFIVNLQGSNNKDVRDRGSYRWEDGKIRLASEYLFTIAIENSVNHDYITEKLWHAFIAGSVPIYLGASNIEDWLPSASNCIIDLRNFTSAKDAAEYVRLVATNRTLYESYHHWRSEPMPSHFRRMLDYFQTVGNYSLDCVLCDMSHRVDQGENLQEIKAELLAAIGRF